MKIKGNIFDLDFEFENELSTQIIDEYKQVNYAEHLKEEIKYLLNNLDFNDSSIEYINLTQENFNEYHYKLMGGKFLAVKLIDSGYQYITSSNYCFTCTDKSLIKLIKNAQRPIKISYDYVDTSTMPLKLVVKILYGKETTSILELVNLFSKEKMIDDIRCYGALAKIYRKLYNSIVDNTYLSYFNLEKDSYYTYYYSNSIIDKYSVQALISTKESQLKALVRTLNLSTINLDKLSLLTYIEEHTNYPTSLIADIGNDSFVELNKVNEELKSLKNRFDNKYSVNTYDFSGQISNIPINYLTASNEMKVIKGSIPNLYLNVALSILRLNKYMIKGNSSNFLENYIVLNCGDISPVLVKGILLVLEAYICGYTETSNIYRYLIEYKDTMISSSDIDVILDFFKNELSDVIAAIDKYNTITYKNYEVKLIEHDVLSPLNTRLLAIQRKIIKSIIREVFSSLENFNSQNNKHMYISDITNESLYILAPEEVSHIAIDTLNRAMLNILKANIKLNEYQCFTDLIT